MRITAFSDSHGQHHDMTVPDGDLLICAGDYCFRGSRKEIDEFAEWMGNLPHEKKIAISGNHDFGAQKYDGYAQQAFMRNGVFYLDDTSMDLEALLIHGSPWTPTFGLWAFMDSDAVLFEDHWRLIPDDVDILITHGPPYSVLDTAHRNKERVGSASMMGTIMTMLEDREKPLIHVFGHIHEGYGEYVEEQYEAYNVSVVDHLYDLVNPVTIIDV